VKQDWAFVFVLNLSLFYHSRKDKGPGKQEKQKRKAIIKEIKGVV